MPDTPRERGGNPHKFAARCLFHLGADTRNMQSGCPARVSENGYGRSLVATADLPAETTVARFAGPVVPVYEDVPQDEVRHAILIGPRQWMVPETPARFMNHSCHPNCRVNDDLDVVTLRPVRAGEEFTISYDSAHSSEELPAWDVRWSFDCRCGAINCRGRIAAWYFEPGPSDDSEEERTDGAA